MRKEEITALFDHQAASYDQQWSRLAPINNALHLLTCAVLSELPANSKILCVGSGTGAEIFHLAQKFPGWRFAAVEPSKAMMDVFQRRAEAEGISHRCVFHNGYLDSLPVSEPFDAATAFLVSQFILDREARSQFFGSIAERLTPAGILVSSDLAGDLGAKESMDLLAVWFRVMSASITDPERLRQMREAYQRDVAVLPPLVVGDIIRGGRFDSPVLFFQAGLIHAWYARRLTEEVRKGDPSKATIAKV